MHSPCASPHSPHLHIHPHPLSSKPINDIVFEVDCQTITIKKGADIDIGTYDP